MLWNVDIPNFYDKTKINSILANSTFSDLSNYYNNTETGAIVSNINLSNNHYAKTETDDIDNELSTSILNTYTKTEVDNLLYTNYPSLSFIADNLYAKSETDSTLIKCLRIQIQPNYILIVIAKLKKQI